MKNKEEIISILNRLPPAGVGNVTDKIRETDAAINMADDLFTIINPTRILETGTHKGGSATLWLSRTNAELLSIDIGAGWVSPKEHEDMCKILEMEFYPRFTFIRDDSTAPNVQEQMRRLGPYDLMFVDGDHSHPYVKKDIETGISLKIPYILLDDYNTCEDVRRAAADTGLIFVKEYPDVHNSAHIGLALFKTP